MTKDDKANVVLVLLLPVIIMAIIFITYLGMGFIDWITGDPLNIINNGLLT